MITNIEHARRFIGVLHGMGCSFALDDFGRGLSSFANLKNLSLDYLKIDGYFIRNLASDNVNQAMVTAMIKLARSLNFQVIAEQVEDLSALDSARRMGVDFVQGYQVGRPTAAAARQLNLYPARRDHARRPVRLSGQILPGHRRRSRHHDAGGSAARSRVDDRHAGGPLHHATRGAAAGIDRNVPDRHGTWFCGHREWSPSNCRWHLTRPARRRKSRSGATTAKRSMRGAMRHGGSSVSWAARLVSCASIPRNREWSTRTGRRESRRTAGSPMHSRCSCCRARRWPT